ncbi:transposable element Tcb2 transposase [Trichonephila clavipes]|nr:transposable element Tcb2 transposase [Trichonephila clavipes]
MLLGASLISGLTGQTGLFARQPQRCIPLKVGHWRYRLKWYKELTNWTSHQWSSAVFKDENRFSATSYSQCHLIWREVGIRFRLSNRGVATTVSAVSMMQGPQPIGAPTCVTTVLVTGLSSLKRGPEGILIQGPLRTSYASAQ